MEKEVKIVAALNEYGESVKFMIYTNKILGSGSFGVVKKAVEEQNPHQELAVKIIPYNCDEEQKKKIDKEIEILKKVPQHVNLVKVLPIKCFSKNNLYIFMEYCGDGTLESLMKEQVVLSEEKIFDIFYQLTSGYKSLWQHGILHQDLKPENVLVKNNKLKITDFGFSILYEGVKLGPTRLGTLPYIPYEKLTQSDYIANPKSDIYALGIIMYRLIMKKHPYVQSKLKTDLKTHLKALDKAKAEELPNQNYSIPFQHFFKLILRMIEKKQKPRISAQELYQEISAMEYFDQFGKLQPEKSEIIELEEKWIVTGETKAFLISFEKQEKDQVQKISVEEQKLVKKVEKEITDRLQNFVYSNRIIVCYFDRLSRRIFVEKQKSKLQKEVAHIYNKIILAFLFLESKIIKDLISETNIPTHFKQQEWAIAKKNNPYLFKQIHKDARFIDQLINDILRDTVQIKIAEQKNLNDLSKKRFQEFIPAIKPILFQFLTIKSSFIANKHSLVTICSIIDGIELMQDIKDWGKKGLEMENYFKEVETMKISHLVNKIVQFLMKNNVDFSFELTQEQEQEAQAQIDAKKQNQRLIKAIEEQNGEELENEPEKQKLI